MDDPAVAADLKKRTIAGLSAKTPADFARTFSSQMGEMTPDMLQLGPGTSMTDQDAAALGCSVLGARMASQDDILAAIETVKKAHIPVLIVTGGWSPSFDATAEVLARLLEGRHVIVRSPNHFVQYTNAEEFNAVASDFMRSADKRSRP
jgi:pimeloyl-ACP methyl ester carboxylesterase